MRALDKAVRRVDQLTSPFYFLLTKTNCPVASFKAFSQPDGLPSCMYPKILHGSRILSKTRWERGLSVSAKFRIGLPRSVSLSRPVGHSLGRSPEDQPRSLQKFARQQTELAAGDQTWIQILYFDPFVAVHACALKSDIKPDQHDCSLVILSIAIFIRIWAIYLAGGFP